MDQAEERLTNLLEKIASEQGYKNYSIDIVPISSGGANYTSVLYKAKIKENNKDDLHLFAKVAVVNEKMREQLEFKLFEAEHFVYTTIKKIFTELEDKHKIPKTDRLVLAKYYSAHTKENEEILVLEDLTAKGFSTFNRHKSFDWEYASASVKALAKFHALAMAFQKEYPKEYDKYTTEFQLFGFNEETFNAMTKWGFDLAVKTVKDENREKLKNFFDKIDSKKFNEMYCPRRKPVLIHADYRVSNLMHLYREDGSVELIPADLQTVHPGCVIFDLLYFIITGTDEEFRRLYFQRLIEHYFTELTAAMARLGVDSSYYTREDFDLELKECLPYGLMIAGFGLPIMTVATEDAPKLGSDLTDLGDMKISSLFAERLNGIVDDYVRWGVL